jgi:hypothetical protein
LEKLGFFKAIGNTLKMGMEKFPESLEKLHNLNAAVCQTRFY